MRQAVIDLGTNTYHLMNVDREANGIWVPIVRHRVFVKMGEQGLQTIGEAAIKRCLDAMKTFKAQLDAAEVDPYHVRAFGTAALRTAKNSKSLLQKIQEQTGIVVQVISGQKEADGIYTAGARLCLVPLFPRLCRTLFRGARSENRNNA